MKAHRVVTKCPTDIRKTNAQIHADSAVAAKIAPIETKQAFKLKRFREVEPRTSTKRGEQAFMTAPRKAAN